MDSEKMTGVSKCKGGNLDISKTKMGETIFSQATFYFIKDHHNF